MIAALLTAATLQMDPSAFASACMAGGGAPGRVEAVSDEETVRYVLLANGSAPVTVMITVNRVAPGRNVYVYTDATPALTLGAGGSGVATGRMIQFMTGENKTFDYCLRLHPG